jgi:hypothetical protein
VAFNRRFGKKAACATPIPAFADAMRRSAAAMSGRRSRSSDGSATGTENAAALGRRLGDRERRRRLADQDRDGVFELRP